MGLGDTDCVEWKGLHAFIKRGGWWQWWLETWLQRTSWARWGEKKKNASQQQWRRVDSPSRCESSTGRGRWASHWGGCVYEQEPPGSHTESFKSQEEGEDRALCLLRKRWTHIWWRIREGFKMSSTFELSLEECNRFSFQLEFWGNDMMRAWAPWWEDPEAKSWHYQSRVSWGSVDSDGQSEDSFV